MVCEREELLASGCAVARAFPTYSSKTPPANPQSVTVGFILVGGGASSITDDDVNCLSAECEGGCGLSTVHPTSPSPPLPPPPGIRLAAEIVDTPTNQMYTDTFIERVRGVASKLGVAAPLVIRGEELQEKGFGGQTEWVWLSC